MTKDEKTYKTVAMGIFAALCTLSTFIQVPAPSGNINLGDCFVVVSGMLLGAARGAVSGGIGAALTDILSGYAVYAPGTLLIKAAMAVAAAFVYKSASKATNNKTLSKIFASAVAEVIMILGYMLCEMLIFGKGAAIAGLWGNFVQAAAAMVASVIVATILEKRVKQ